MPAQPSSLLIYRRDQFSGRNDIYASPGRDFNNPLNLALNADRPYDLLGNYAGLRDLAFTQTRLRRYREAFNFYEGIHYENAFEDGEKKPVFNYCETIVNKAVDWFIANGFTVRSDVNPLVGTMLDAIWEANNKSLVTAKATLYSVITGDSFYMVTVQTKDSNGNLLPRSKWRPTVQALNPGYVHPLFDDADPTKMKAVMYQCPKVIEGAIKLYTLYIDANEWIEWVNDAQVQKGTNIFGRVNIVHCPNFQKGTNLFGQSDIASIIPINVEYNDVALAIRRVIRYHSEPTTLVYGIRLSSLEKSAKKVWSNLPLESKVENLELKSELTANFSYLDRLERQIQEMSETPKVAFDAYNLAISNTSGLAMELMFQPLLAKTTRRRIAHKGAMKEVNSLLIDAMTFCGEDLRDIADDPSRVYDTDVDYTSVLPRDEVTELGAAQQKLTMGIWSVAEAQRRLSGVKDLPKLTLELMADMRYNIAEAKELAVANLGGKPNYNVVLLSSIALATDFSELAQEAEEPEPADNNSLATQQKTE